MIKIPLVKEKVKIKIITFTTNNISNIAWKIKFKITV